NVESYVIEPCPSVQIDTTGYSIPLPQHFPESGPNALHLIHGNEEYFRAAWDGKSLATLDTTTLKNVRGRSSFSGFRAGETYILGVGRDNFPAPEMKFNVLWAALIKVSSTAQPGGIANGSQPHRSETNSTSGAAH